MQPDIILSTNYNEKQPEYFEGIRHDAIALIPEKVSRVLEIGCGTGNTLAWLKDHGICDWVCGVELSEAPAKELAEKLDEFYIGNIEYMTLPIEKESLDLILCLDVLEHLIDPWKIINNLRPFLKPGGRLIASIPNIRNLRALIPLVLSGNWQYGDAGILDKTHLRFFTLKTATDLMECSGLVIDKICFTGVNDKSRMGWLNRLTFGVFKHFLITQYIISAKN